MQTLSQTILQHSHTHPFNGPFSGTTQVSQYQKGKPIWILLKQEAVSGSGTSWAICKSASCSRQITTPAPHHSVFYRPDALPAAQPTASKHWRQRSYTTESESYLRKPCMLHGMFRKLDVRRKSMVIFCIVIRNFVNRALLLKCPFPLAD